MSGRMPSGRAWTARRAGHRIRDSHVVHRGRQYEPLNGNSLLRRLLVAIDLRLAHLARPDQGRDPGMGQTVAMLVHGIAQALLSIPLSLQKRIDGGRGKLDTPCLPGFAGGPLEPLNSPLLAGGTLAAIDLFLADLAVLDQGIDTGLGQVVAIAVHAGAQARGFKPVLATILLVVVLASGLNRFADRLGVRRPGEASHRNRSDKQFRMIGNHQMASPYTVERSNENGGA